MKIINLYYDCHILRKYWNQLGYKDLLNQLSEPYNFIHIYKFPIHYRLDNRFERRFFYIDTDKFFAMWYVEDLINSIIDKININHNVFLAFPNH